jgi:hypothetical protein
MEPQGKDEDGKWSHREKENHQLHSSKTLFEIAL